ncbi:MAG: GNAT family N-acetyltransferase [Xanthomonadales bacterium]|nr:Mycothiol acetyltransferase [Xanthomonadales bacterium]MCC6594563.1 GNAT family N-acetyltransferase [Xanthomonadales bacterium]MCE7931009.1 GNAT family N-acetyltransferase [Xanthomonadales bacterium PRO6]
MAGRRFSGRGAKRGRTTAARSARTGLVRVRRAAARDLPALLELEGGFSGDRLSARQFTHHVAATSSDLIVADLAGAVLGYALLFRRRGSRIGRVYSIAVAPAMRGQGLGARLLLRLEAIARLQGLEEMRLEVRQDNAPALALYQQRGYVIFGARPAYYEDGADAWRLAKSLLPPRRRVRRIPARSVKKR